MVSSELWFGAEDSFYNGVVTQSARFDDGSSSYLSRTPSGAGNQKTWTWSGWVKKTQASTSDIAMFSANGGGDTWFLIGFSGSNTGIDVDWYNGSTRLARKFSNAVFRDCSSWYHVVVAVDTTQTDADNRIKVYINSEQITSWSVSTNPSQDSDTYINSTNLHTIGKNASTSRSTYFDGYLAEINLIDGSQLTPTSFGENKNGVWIPIEYTGSYGTNGFRLQFTGFLGTDTSGQSNNWTPNGFDAEDTNIPDCPENNFPTLNPLEFQENNSGAFTAEGNLKWSNVNANINSTFGFGNQGGKYYWEYLYVSSTDSNQYQGVTLPKDGISLTNSFATGIALYFEDGTTRVDGVSGTGFAGKINADNIIQFKLDLDNGTLEFGKNNTYISALTLPTSLGGWRAGGIQSAGSGGTRVFVANYGQDSSFAGNKTAQGNTDANGIGDFYYAPPSGFLAVCSANLPEPTISPNANTQAVNHFGTLAYTGDGNQTRTITSGASGIDGELDFQPDWVVHKIRTGTAQGALNFDSSRGFAGAYGLDWSANTAEGTVVGANSAEYGYISGVGTNSFDVNDGTVSTNGGFVNYSGRTYVAWNWLAGGATPTKTYKVVVVSDSGNKYRFRNSADSATFAQSAVTLDLQEGGTYVFDWSDSSAQGHPIRFSTTSDGTHGGGSEYTTGVVKDDSAYTTTITVASSAPQLYYYCQNHSGMGGSVNTNSTFGSTNFDGSTLSISNENTTSGFSIIKYTGNATAGATVGHGLGKAPKWVITKERDGTYSWLVGHDRTATDPWTDAVLLDSNGAVSDSNLFWNDTAPNSSVITLGGAYNPVNGNNLNYVMYAFAEIDGYSKFGQYTGNASTDGTFIYLGFRPAFFMVKAITGTNNWIISDSVRSPTNVTGNWLYADGTFVEDTGSSRYLDFVSNGVKLRNGGTGTNSNGVNYIYMAFAEQPFKFANAR